MAEPVKEPLFPSWRRHAPIVVVRDAEGRAWFSTWLPSDRGHGRSIQLGAEFFMLTFGWGGMCEFYSRCVEGGRQDEATRILVSRALDATPEQVDGNHTARVLAALAKAHRSYAYASV